jgi:DNA-binding winged helix-turn-helix (wHTH) protein
MTKNYRFGRFRLDAEAEVLFRGSEVVGLGRRAVALLSVLVQHAGAPVSKDALIAIAWGGLAVEESNLPVQIAALRRVLAEEPGGESWIETLPRRGYRFASPICIEEQVGGAWPTGAGATPHHRDQPSIAILPFVNLSGDVDQKQFGDAIANESSRRSRASAGSLSSRASQALLSAIRQSTCARSLDDLVRATCLKEVIGGPGSACASPPSLLTRRTATTSGPIGTNATVQTSSRSRTTSLAAW